VGGRRLRMTPKRPRYGKGEATSGAALRTISRKAVPFAALMACAGCAVPNYDVSSRSDGLPTILSTIKHIKCELTDLVRRPVQEGSGPVDPLEQGLLNGDYDVQLTLELEVNDTGGLTPSVTFMEPITKLISFSLGGSANLSESRDHHFTDNFQLSMRQLYADAHAPPDKPHLVCPTDDNDLGRTLGLRDNLRRTLGIRDFVAMGFDTDRLPTAPPKTAQTKTPQTSQQQSASITTATEAFGGVITFLVTKNVSGFGPTWTTTRWKGPGGLVGLSQVNTDKLTLAFAQGPNAGTKMPSIGTTIDRNPPNLGAYNFTQQQLNQTISSQIQTLQSQLSP
jgi:hypothetical protein